MLVLVVVGTLVYGVGLVVESGATQGLGLGMEVAAVVLMLIASRKVLREWVTRRFGARGGDRDRP